MKKFTLIFRTSQTAGNQPSAEQMKSYMDSWMKWINDLSEKGKLAEIGNSFSPTEGRVLKSGDEVFDGIYESNGPSLAGYIVISADDLEEATSLAKGCPMLQASNNSVEIRLNNTTQEMKESETS